MLFYQSYMFPNHCDTRLIPFWQQLKHERLENIHLHDSLNNGNKIELREIIIQSKVCSKISRYLCIIPFQWNSRISVTIHSLNILFITTVYEEVCL